MFSYTKIVVALILLFYYYYFAKGQVISGGPCPRNIAVKPDFDAERYQGIWHEYEKYPIGYSEISGKCVNAQYILQDDGVICVKNSMIITSTGEETYLYGFGVQYENAKYNFTFPGFDVSSNYWVLATDYETYSVVYACEPIIPTMHSIKLWILTRQRIPSVLTVHLAENALVENGLSLQPLVKSVQAGCQNECEDKIEQAK